MASSSVCGVLLSKQAKSKRKKELIFQSPTTESVEGATTPRYSGIFKLNKHFGPTIPTIQGKGVSKSIRTTGWLMVF